MSFEISGVSKHWKVSVVVSQLVYRCLSTTSDLLCLL
jgi:hypothetical protein